MCAGHGADQMCFKEKELSRLTQVPVRTLLGPL